MENETTYHGLGRGYPERQRPTEKNPPNFSQPRETRRNCIPFPSLGVPESVNKVLIILSKLQLGSELSESSAKCFNISRKTSSSDVAVSSRMMLARARKPSRSRWALTSSSKFFNFRYCEEKQTNRTREWRWCLTQATALEKHNTSSPGVSRSRGIINSFYGIYVPLISLPSGNLFI